MDDEDSTSGASSIRDIYLRWSSNDSLGQTSDDSDDDPEIASLVSTSSSEDENDKDNDRNIHHKSKSRSSTNTTTRTRWSLLTQNWLPEGPWQVGGLQLLEAEGVKLFKFFGITVLSILFVHYYAIVVVRTMTSISHISYIISDPPRMNDDFSFLVPVFIMIAHAFYFRLLVFGTEC
jgi:hypothetical protein